MAMKIREKKHTLSALFSRFRSKRVAILGDLMLDEFKWGDAQRISPEAPIPVVNILKTVCHPGGAANVGENVLALGANPIIFGVIGGDETGRTLLARLRDEGADVVGVVEEENRPTTRKTRIIAHNQQMVRVDRESTEPITRLTQKELVRRLDAVLDSIDALIISDYEKGVITPALVGRILPLLEEKGVRCYVDPKGNRVKRFPGVFLAKLGKPEAERVARVEIRNSRTLERAARKIMAFYGCKYVVITLGSEGMCVLGSHMRLHRISTLAREVYDVTGAGDTTLATLALAMTAGASPLQAARLASVAASIVVGKVGTAVAKPPEIQSVLRTNKWLFG